MSKPLRVLVVEDSEDDALLAALALQEGGYELDWERVDTSAAMEAALAAGHWDAVIADYSLPHFSAPAALDVLRASGLDLPFIIVSGNIGEDTAVAAMKAGAHDYIMKGSLARLVPAMERELRDAEARAQRARLEAQLLQSQKMEAIGRLAGGVAHDFNNLLTVIGGCADLILKRVDSPDPVHHLAQEIVAAGEHAASLTQQLLAFSRRQLLRAKVVDLNEIVLDTEKMLRRLIGEDITLVSRLSPGLGRVTIDPGQIGQVIINLAVNARDAMPRGGVLTIETANADIATEAVSPYGTMPPGAYVMVTVSDTGTGMDAETQARAFEPFFTTKGVGKGTGLGLATTYGIVRQSGGYIWLQSKLGEGSTFQVYLPRLAEASAESGSAAAPALTTPATETILLVEDDAQVRALTQMVLATAGYNVLVAEGPEHALRLSAQCAAPIHLLLTDVVMPGMSGRELSEQLAPQRPAMRVLFMSGYTDDAVIRHGVLDEHLTLLRKPFTPHALEQQVRALLDAPPVG